jgi:hypothetical protein
MKQDPVLETLQAGATAGSVQRIVPEHHRYRWEQQWLRENRAVSDVVDNGAGHATTLAQSMHLAAADDAHPHRSGAAAQSAAASKLPAATAIGAAPADQAAAATMPRPAVGFDAPAPTLPWPQPATSAALATPEDAPPVAAAALAAQRRTALKQFAMWRTDDEVKIALRIDESAQPAALDALRQWLKDLRLKLASLTVNGSVRWQSRSRNTDGQY